MLESFRLGGWGMYPTLVFGLLCVGLSGWYGALPSQVELARLRILTLLTVTCGALGLVTGLMKTLEYAAGTPEQGKFIALGSFESLHNLSLALALLAFAGLLRLGRTWMSVPPSASGAPSAVRQGA